MVNLTDARLDGEIRRPLAPLRGGQDSQGYTHILRLWGDRTSQVFSTNSNVRPPGTPADSSAQ